MKRNDLRSVIVGTVASLVAGGTFAADAPAPAGKTENCYGIVKAGQNGCATAKHACSGMAAKDNLPDEWAEVPAGTCVQQGGTLKAPKKKSRGRHKQA